MRNKILQALIQSPHKRDDALPSVRMLMATFKASSGTVQAVLRQLQDNGQIYCIRGKGCFWGSAPQQIKLPMPRENATTRLNRLFDDDWKHGKFKPNDPLPLLKELSERYHASLPLLRKFLAQKIEAGILQQMGRRYYFAQNQRDMLGASSHRLSELIFVTRCNSWGGFTAESERELDFLRLIYKTAGARKYKLILLGMEENSGELIDRSGQVVRLQDYPNAVGALLSTLLVQKPLPLLQIFAGVKFPVAIWWEQPLDTIPKFYLNKPHWAFFNSTFGEMPGIELGKYLVNNDVSHVTFFSPYHNSSWSKDRLTGLQKAGLQVESQVDVEFASPWDYRQIARASVAKQSVEAYSRRLLKKKLMTLISAQGENIDQDDWWVCVNDEVAGLFIEMAEDGECLLPGDRNQPHIIAFDNSAESYLLRIRSYDFNTDALVEQMFYYLENPEIGKNKIHHILGNVVEK